MIKYFSSFSHIPFFSKFLILMRDILIANSFGTGLLADAFFGITRIPTLITSVFNEGALLHSFFPIFSRLFRKDRRLSLQFSNKIQWIFTLGVIVGFVLAEVFMEEVLSFSVPGLINNTNKEIFAVLGRIIFPLILFIPITALYSTMLYSQGKFHYIYLCSIATNALVMAVIFFSRRDSSLLLFQMSYAILISAIIQVLFMLYALERNKILPISTTLSLDKRDRNFCKRFFYLAFTSEIYQINMLVSVLFASTIPHAISSLHYADVIIQLFVAIIGANASLFPLTSEEQDREKALLKQNKSIKTALTIGIPITALLVLLAPHIIKSFFFLGGKFDTHCVERTITTLEVLAFTLLAHVLNKIFLSNLLSIKQVETPIIFGIVSIILNVILNLFLIHDYSYRGITISLCITTWLNMALLIIYLRRKALLALGKEIPSLLVRIFIATSLMIFAIQLCNAFIESHPGISDLYLTRVISLGSICTISFGIYYFSLRGMSKFKEKSLPDSTNKKLKS